MKSDFKAVKAVQIIFGAIILSCCIFWGIYGIGINGLNLFLIIQNIFMTMNFHMFRNFNSMSLRII